METSAKPWRAKTYEQSTTVASYSCWHITARVDTFWKASSNSSRSIKESVNSDCTSSAT